MDRESALAALTKARVIDLEQPRYIGMPAYGSPVPPFSYTLHRRHADTYAPAEHGPRTSASGAIICNDHAGTHVDALCHQAEAFELHGGVHVDSSVETPAGYKCLGAETIPPIVIEAVLLDVARAKGLDILPESYPITDADLEHAASVVGGRMPTKGAILIRTGFGQAWHEPHRYVRCAGMTPEANRWLLRQEPSVVGADCLSWDLPGLRDKETKASLVGHLLLEKRAGIFIFENLLLEELSAADCPRFVFVAAPLKVVGATGGLARPIAILV